MDGNKIKRIGIDARFYGPIGKGLGRYTKEVVDRVIKLDEQNEYVIFLSRENFAEFKTANPKVRKVLSRARWYTLAEQILMPYLIFRENLDLMHFPHFNVPVFCPVKFIVTIHDLILTKYPSQRATTLGPLFYKLKHFLYKVVINSAVKKSTKIITVSEFTKSDIIKQFNIKDDKIVVTCEGVADNLKNAVSGNTESVLGKYEIKKPFLLYVGNAYPHKNLEKLIEVFSKTDAFPMKEGEEGINDFKSPYTPFVKGGKLTLVLVGKDDYFYNRVKDFAKRFLSSNIIFPGFVPDYDLSVLYRQAVAYIFPSLYEGFGLPPLEAMAAGCPVISSNAASMPEILDDSALYFDPTSTDDMEKKIRLIVSDEKLRKELIVKGNERIKKYSWDECARKTLEIYNKF